MSCVGVFHCRLNKKPKVTDSLRLHVLSQRRTTFFKVQGGPFLLGPSFSLPKMGFYVVRFDLNWQGHFWWLSTPKQRQGLKFFNSHDQQGLDSTLGSSHWQISIESTDSLGKPERLCGRLRYR